MSHLSYLLQALRVSLLFEDVAGHHCTGSSTDIYVDTQDGTTLEGNHSFLETSTHSLELINNNHKKTKWPFVILCPIG